METLLFTDSFKEALADRPMPYIESLYLTNTVMHASTLPHSVRSGRRRFWGVPLASRGETPHLRLLSNDDTSTMNFRLDTCSGRFLSFTKEVRRALSALCRPASPHGQRLTFLFLMCFAGESYSCRQKHSGRCTAVAVHLFCQHSARQWSIRWWRICRSHYRSKLGRNGRVYGRNEHGVAEFQRPRLVVKQVPGQGDKFEHGVHASRVPRVRL